MKHKSTRLAQLSLTAVVAMFVMVTLLAQTTYAALTNISPNPNDMFATGGNPNREAGGISHMLKKENVAKVHDLTLGVYYPKSTGGDGKGRTIDINYGIGGKKCLIKNIKKTNNATGVVVGDNDKSGHFFDNAAYIEVKLQGKNSSQTYKVPIENVCKNRANNPMNVEGNGNGWKNNRLFGRYRLPANMQDTLSDTGKYRVVVTIAYEDAVNQGPSDTNSVNFRVGSENKSIIGPLKDSNQRGFGLRNAYFQDNPEDKRGDLFSVQFGLKCDSSKLTDREVALYDPDIGVFGTTYLYVTENGKKLDKNRYVSNGAKPSENVKWVPSRGEWRADTGNGTSRLVIDKLTPGATYKFVVVNPDQSSGPGKTYAPPNGNVLSVSIPEDAIYGDVDCNYNLRPQIRLAEDQSKVYPYYPNVNVEGSIEDTGMGNIAVGNHPWQIFAARFRGNPDRDMSQTSAANNPCNVAKAQGGDMIDSECGFIRNRVYPAHDTAQVNYQEGGPDDLGMYLCFFTRVQKPKQSSTSEQWRYSDLVCVLASAQPRLQVLGHDVRTNGSINTSLARIEGTTYGSWGEYGILSQFANTNTASGAGLRKGAGAPAQDGWSTLTFANTNPLPDPENPTDSPYGNFGPISRLTNFTTTNVETLASGSHIGPKNYNKDRKTILVGNGNGTLYIDKDLKYTGSYNSIGDLPRVIIVAKNVIINADVKRIDPWIIASGSISTCGEARVGANYFDYGVKLKNGMCGNELTFNGPVITNSIYLFRTHFSSTERDEPAETFNLRADAFLSSLSGGGTDNPVATTDLVTELPPRF